MTASYLCTSSSWYLPAALLWSVWRSKWHSWHLGCLTHASSQTVFELAAGCSTVITLFIGEHGLEVSLVLAKHSSSRLWQFLSMPFTLVRACSCFAYLGCATATLSLTALTALAFHTRVPEHPWTPLVAAACAAQSPVGGQHAWAVSNFCFCVLRFRSVRRGLW